MHMRLVKGRHYLGVTRADLMQLREEALERPELVEFVARAGHFEEFDPDTEVLVFVEEDELEAIQGLLTDSVTDESSDVAGAITDHISGEATLVDLYHEAEH